MGSSYTKPYTDYYDIRAESLFQNVGQHQEFFEFVFDDFAKIPVDKILDVGCGTGRHYIPLMKDGYSVTGLDPSCNMLNVLKKKAEEADLEANIVQKDMRDMDFADQFDAIICMNSAFHYLLTDEDISRSLQAFHKALKLGGVAIIDMMNFLSLLGTYKENLIKTYDKNGVSIKQAIKHWVEDVPGIFDHDEFGVIEDNGKIITYHELHRFRMLNYNEMRRFLHEAGFCKVKCFGNLIDREEVSTNARRLIFVVVK